jgi:CRISPR-associated endonuclease/helicase Cas3
VFEPEDALLPAGAYRLAAGVTRAMLNHDDFDRDDPGASADRYFRQLFATADLDGKQVQEARRRFDYPEVARRFRMIDEPSTSAVITCFGTPEEQAHVRLLLENMRAHRGDLRLLLRSLQPFIVSLRLREGFFLPLTPDSDLGEWHGAQADELNLGMALVVLLIDPELHRYDPTRRLCGRSTAAPKCSPRPRAPRRRVLPP